MAQVIASNRSAYMTFAIQEVMDSLGVNDDANSLLDRCMDSFIDWVNGPRVSMTEAMARYAEAEALLRTGWSPS